MSVSHAPGNGAWHTRNLSLRVPDEPKYGVWLTDRQREP
jgi:hypothetical protein